MIFLWESTYLQQYWHWWYKLFWFPFLFFFHSFIQSALVNQMIRCQVTWTSMNNCISSFFPFPHFFLTLFLETASPVWTKTPMCLLPIHLLNVLSPKPTQAHIQICLNNISFYFLICYFFHFSYYCTPLHFLTLSQNREMREKKRKTCIIFSSVPLSRLPN